MKSVCSLLLLTDYGTILCFYGALGFNLLMGVGEIFLYSVDEVFLVNGEEEGPF